MDSDEIGGRSEMMGAQHPGSIAFSGVPLNPGNPYNNSRTENGFGTFGGPDFAATLGEVATKALEAVWYQKWFVHLRPPPEAIGGLVRLIKTGWGNRLGHNVRFGNGIHADIHWR